MVQYIGTMPNEGEGSRLMMLGEIEPDQGLGALGSLNLFVILGLGLIIFGGAKLLWDMKHRKRSS